MKEIFIKSLFTRPVNRLDISTLLESDMESGRKYLSTGSKELWFYVWCQENGVAGAIESELVRTEPAPPIPCAGVEGGYFHYLKEYWEARILINGTIVSKAQASQSICWQDKAERDNGSSTIRQSAIGAALSQAGFGVISSYEMEEAEKAEILARQNEGGDATLPFTIPAGEPQQSAPVPPAPAGNPFFPAHQTAHVGAGQPVQPQTPPAAPSVPPVVPAPVADPLEAAKSVVFNGRGKFSGLTLGQILSGVGGQRNIQWLATTFQPRDADGQKVQEAARVIAAAYGC